MAHMGIFLPLSLRLLNVLATHMCCRHLVVTSTSKKLECQNKLLEEELQAKGKRKTICKPPDNQSCLETVRRPPDGEGDENAVECGKAQPVQAAVRVEARAEPTETRRRVSILEDLEKELNREKDCHLTQRQGPFPLAMNKPSFHPPERNSHNPKPVIHPVSI